MTNAAAANLATTDNLAAAANAVDPVAAAAAAAQAEWQADFCSRYAHLLFEYGRWFLLAALIVGTLSALAAVVRMFLPAEEEGESGGSILGTSVAALTALIDSLAKAPTWIAMLGAALALMWMSGHSQPRFCPGSQDLTANDTAAQTNGQAESNEAAEDESGG